MGNPKQLLRYRGQSLVRRASETAARSVCDRVVVVIGSRAHEMRHELDGLPVSVMENADWQTGISSSIRAGVEELAKDEPDGAIIMLCDQPFVTTRILDSLVATYIQTGKPIVASSYERIQGVPAFFSRALFNKLTSLTADEGARRIIFKHPELVATIPFPQGGIDLDTPHDYELIQSRSEFLVNPAR